MAEPCDNDRGMPDGDCGYCRGFVGLTSRLGTTTAEVVEYDSTMAQYGAAHLARLLFLDYPDDATTRQWAYEDAQKMVRIAADFPIGTVVERRGDRTQKRPL